MGEEVVVWGSEGCVDERAMAWMRVSDDLTRVSDDSMRVVDDGDEDCR
jgi:hypothetical protein